MVKPDVITTQTYAIDYPLWRHHMEKYSHYFNNVIVSYYNDYRKHNFREFIQSALPFATHIDTGVVPSGKDWRNYTVREALKVSKAEWVLFLEQDMVVEDGFYEDILNEAENFDVVGLVDDHAAPWSASIRLHPAFILVRRSFIDRTSQDFGAYPDKGRDHFGVFSEELYGLNPRLLDIRGRKDWKHYAGLYSNYDLVQFGGKPNYKPEEFKQYVKLAIDAPVVQDARFIKWSNECLN